MEEEKLEKLLSELKDLNATFQDLQEIVYVQEPRIEEVEKSVEKASSNTTVDKSISRRRSKTIYAVAASVIGICLSVVIGVILI